MSEVQIVEAHPGTPGNSLGHDPIPENKGIERKRGEEIKIKRPPYMFFYTTVRNHRTLFQNQEDHLDHNRQIFKRLSKYFACNVWYPSLPIHYKFFYGH